MNKRRFLAWFFVITALQFLQEPGVLGQDEIDLARLTAPPGRLTPGCVLSPAPTVAIGNNQVRGGLWGGLPRNPWTGTERAIVADIAEHVFGSPPLPDGPPLSAAELTRFRLRFADDIVEAYGAVYTDDTGMHLVTVNAVRLKTTPANRPRGNPGARLQLVHGRTVAALFGESDGCFDALAKYLRETMVD